MNIVKPISKFFKKNGSLILSLTASAGVIGTAVLTGDSALKINKLLNDIPDSELKTNATKLKIVKLSVPPVLAAAGTIICIISAHCLNKSIQVSLIAAYTGLYSTFESYRYTIKESYGKEIDSSIMDTIARYKSIKEMEDILNTPHTEEMELWVDDYHDKPYWAKKSDILNAVAHLNKQINNISWSKGYATMDEYYGLIPGCEIEEQDRCLGWSYDRLIEDYECNVLEAYFCDWFMVYNGTEDDPIYVRKDSMDEEDYRNPHVPVNYITFNIDPSADLLD